VGTVPGLFDFYIMADWSGGARRSGRAIWIATIFYGENFVGRSK
jgi:hypothetical protein